MPTQPTVTDVHSWADELDAVGARLASQFARSEPRHRAVAYLRGLLSDAGRKNGWQLAERAPRQACFGHRLAIGLPLGPANANLTPAVNFWQSDWFVTAGVNWYILAPYA